MNGAFVKTALKAVVCLFAALLLIHSAKAQDIRSVQAKDRKEASINSAQSPNYFDLERALVFQSLAKPRNDIKSVAPKEPSPKKPLAKKADETSPSSSAAAAPNAIVDSVKIDGSLNTPEKAEDPPYAYKSPKTVKEEKPASDAEQQDADFVIVDNRWKIEQPDWDRHDNRDKADYPMVRGAWWNPYRQNKLKGDYPISGKDKFLIIKLSSETFLSARRAPSIDRSAKLPSFFGSSEQFLLNQYFTVGGDFYKGAAGYKPADWRFHVEAAFNVNYSHLDRGDAPSNSVESKIEEHLLSGNSEGFIALQEIYTEYRLGDTPRVFPFLRGRGSRGGYSPFFDTTSVRFGIQKFNSDFRGLIFNDSNLGARLFGNFASNRYQFNLALFKMLDKDARSGLNTLNLRDQSVLIANLYRQDTFTKGLNVELSYHYNRDDRNLLNRALANSSINGLDRKVRAHYIGAAANGHIGERLPWIFGNIGGGLNVSAAFYQVFGSDGFNEIARRKVDINARLAMAELSTDRDWMRFRTTFLYASGDDSPNDGTAGGFDSIFDNANIAGGVFNYLSQVGMPQLGGSEVQMTSRNSLLVNLRSNRSLTQSNFVNPGIMLYGAGWDANLTQKLRLITNVNFTRFAHTEPLKHALLNSKIKKSIGVDYHVGVKYRPFLNENFTIASGVAFFHPGTGFRSIYEGNCETSKRFGCDIGGVLVNVFTAIKFVY